MFLYNFGEEVGCFGHMSHGFPSLTQLDPFQEGNPLRAGEGGGRGHLAFGVREGEVTSTV